MNSSRTNLKKKNIIENRTKYLEKHKQKSHQQESVL